MNTEIYNRQETIHLEVPREVTVIGCGGVGAWVAIYLAMSGVEQLHIMDHDVLDITNLNRLPFKLNDIGLSKTVCLRNFILETRPRSFIFEYGQANSISLLLTAGAILDCTDRHGTQLFLEKWAREHDRQYIRAGYDGLHITVTSLVSEWTDGSNDTGYENTPSWVVPASVVAALAVAKLMLNRRIEISCNIDELGTSSTIKERASKIAKRRT